MQQSLFKHLLWPPVPEKTKHEVGLADVKGGVHLTGDMPLAALRQKHCHASFSQSSAINGSHLPTDASQNGAKSRIKKDSKGTTQNTPCLD